MGSPALRTLLGIAATLVSLALLRQMSDVLVVLLQSLFLASIASGPVRRLQARGVGRPWAIGLVIFILALLVGVVAYFVTISVSMLYIQLPDLGERADQMLHTLARALLQFRIRVPVEVLARHFNPEQILAAAGAAITGLGGFVLHGVFVFLMVIFLLIEFQRLPIKLDRLTQHPTRTLLDLREIATTMTRYVAIKTVIAGLSAFFSWIALVAIGVDQPLVWAVLTFLLNYIPDIGPILSAVPPALFALFQHGPIRMLWVIIAYIVIKMVFGNIYGVGLMGKHLNLSPVVVLFSVGLWGWVFGPTGVFLGVPITAALKLALERYRETEWVAILLSDHPRPERLPS